jgi:hypothetical protein
MISNYRIGEDVEGSGRDLICGIVPAFTWKGEKPQSVYPISGSEI